MMLISTVIFGGLYFRANPFPVAPVSIFRAVDHPLAAVSEVYRSVEQSNWSKVRELTSQQVWTNLNENGFRKYWQGLLAKDSSLDYVSFVVMRWEKENDFSAWVLGRAVWVSSKRIIPDNTQKITLRLENNHWIISDIQFFPAVDQVGKFFTAVSQNNWETAGELANDKAIMTMKAQNSNLSKSRYITDDFAIAKNKAWVKGKLITGGKEPAVMQVHVQLNKNAGNKWYITKIVGTWPEK